MVPFGVPNIIQHLLFRVPKKDNYPYRGALLGAWDVYKVFEFQYNYMVHGDYKRILRRSIQTWMSGLRIMGERAAQSSESYHCC